MNQIKDADNPLWDFSLRTYQRQDVEDICLALQEQQQVDVNLLLYAAWLARQGMRLSAGHLLEMEAAVQRWRDEVVRPLRELRGRLRDFPAARDIREGVKQLELAAERGQQDIMLALYRRVALPAVGQVACRDNLALLAGPAIDEPLWTRLGQVLNETGGN